MGLLIRPAGQTCWTNQLARPAGQTSWTDQLDRPAGQTSSFYLKPWPVRIFKDWPFSLYFVAASESVEGVVFHFFISLSPSLRDICHGNTCSRNIWFWPNLEPHFSGSKILLDHICLDQKSLENKFFGPYIFRINNFFGTNFFSPKFFGAKKGLTLIILDLKVFKFHIIFNPKLGYFKCVKTH